ncbi:type 1 glutamine amidotransferase domain-containing protein [Acidocella sp.]|jgi:protease I|uniref:type 1 glutamine amidotransferase domain-containing protein n=1 Tax=Acidocella sp. TaxID=50710 RepID=UPI002625B5AB|nr:type 1 glutamine amidotransferase domain-containing protein [Acidocella sp.]
MSNLKSLKVAVLATDGFEQSELTEPVRALREAGAEPVVVAPHGGEIQGMRHHEKGDKVKVDQTLDRVDAKSFDALVLPGGVANPDELRTNKEAMAFVRHFVEAGKPVAAICHGPWSLVEVGAVKGRKLTSWPSLRTDIKNAGGEWVDQEVVVDGMVITSRKPDDLPAFNKALIKMLESRPARHAA